MTPIPMTRIGSSPSDLSKRAWFLSCIRNVMRRRFDSSAPAGRQSVRLTCIGAMSKEVRYDRHS